VVPCPQVWKPTDKNMVGCDSCDFWIHDHCDTEAARVLASNAEDETYYCPPCRQASAAQVSRLMPCRNPAFEPAGCRVHRQYPKHNGHTATDAVWVWVFAACAARGAGAGGGGAAAGAAPHRALRLRDFRWRDAQVRADGRTKARTVHIKCSLRQIVCCAVLDATPAMSAGSTPPRSR
jgi:hypothetical protein